MNLVNIKTVEKLIEKDNPKVLRDAYNKYQSVDNSFRKCAIEIDKLEEQLPNTSGSKHTELQTLLNARCNALVKYEEQLKKEHKHLTREYNKYTHSAQYLYNIIKGDKRFFPKET